MKCINFDERFADFTAKWMKEHRGEYKTYDEMEDDLPRVYTEFLNMPAKWLDGVTPGAYFTQFEDAKDLVDWMVQYCQKDIPVPDMLMEQIQAVGRPCEKRLLTLLRDESDAIPEEARMTAIGLLRDMGSTLPKMLYIQWQMNREMKDDLADNALDSLRDMGKEALQPMLENLNKANEAGQEALLDVLANFPGHENVYQLAVRLFEKNPNRRALFASYLAKLGDPRALPILIAAANEENCRYMDFIELRAAIEELGGEAPEREFYDDPEYEALHPMDDGDDDTPMQEGESMVTLADIQKNEDIKALISAGNRYLAAMGFTEHGPRHVSYVSRTAAGILAALHFSPREVELAAIAGWVHDVGNSVNRHDHGPLGAVLLLPILRETGMAMDDVMEIITAVGNHEEQSGFISSAVSAALALGDKSDAHKTRVRGGKPDLNDIHDRVNFSIQENRVIVDPVKRIIRHELTMDESSSVMEYLQIYMSRIVMCEQAAAFLKCSFDLVINGQTINNRP